MRLIFDNINCHKKEKKSFRKYQPRLINYSFYKNFSKETFRVSLLGKLSKEVFVKTMTGCKGFVT